MPAPKDPTKHAEWRQKLAKAHTGKSVTEETRLKISNSMRGKIVGKKGEDSPVFGTHKSEEFKEMLRKRMTGRIVSDITRQKISAAQTGKILPLTTRQKMSASRKGHPVTKETRLKISNSHTGLQAGEKSPAWKGGISFEPYCPKFNRDFKERVRAFFGHTCQMCGHVWQPGEKRLAVHHVNYQKDACCSDAAPPLFVPVCLEGCHSKTNFNREHWERFFTELIMTKYDGQCYLPKEESK
jgi:hypothetical protein